MTVRVDNAAFLSEVARLVGEGHTVTLPLRGYSMRPFLENGRDKAVLGRPEGVGVGDVVLARIGDGRYVLHRIVSIDGDGGVVLLGDGNLSTESCHMGSIVARALGFYRKGRSTIDSTSGMKWRAYSAIWMRLRPFRRYLLFVYRNVFCKQ